MAIIPLSKGKYTIIDDEDVERVTKYKWHTSTTNYARRSIRIRDINNKSIKKTLMLHRFIMNLDDPKLEVDHINNNRLDNRKNNLRIVSPTINRRNLNKRKNGTSKYLGVHFHKIRQKWRAQIRNNNKVISLGMFLTEEEEAMLKRKQYIMDNNLIGYKLEEI